MSVPKWRPGRRRAKAVCAVMGVSSAVVWTITTRPANANPDAASAAAAPNRQQSESVAPSVLPAEPGAPEVLVYPPYDVTQARPITVMLHGMCNAPERECPYFADAVRRRSWLICPRASLRCEGGGAIWSYKRRAQTVERAVARVKDHYPGLLDDGGGRVLMGFSLGAITGMHLAHSAGGKWRSVILIGAKVHPDAELLQRQGVRRLLMVAGDYDMMKPHMLRESRRLQRRGMHSAFLSLGRVGHTFPENMNALMSHALAWAYGDDGALAAAVK
jgi:predicted esterase